MRVYVKSSNFGIVFVNVIFKQNQNNQIMKRWRKAWSSKWTRAREKNKNKTPKKAETLPMANKEMKQPSKNKTISHRIKIKIKKKLIKRIFLQKAAETHYPENFWLDLHSKKKSQNLKRKAKKNTAELASSVQRILFRYWNEFKQSKNNKKKKNSSNSNKKPSSSIPTLFPKFTKANKKSAKLSMKIRLHFIPLAVQKCMNFIAS